MNKLPNAPLTAEQRDLVASCVPMAYYLSRRVGLHGEFQQDNDDAAIDELIVAAARFDGSRNNKFSTMAMHYIRNGLLHRRCDFARKRAAKRPRPKVFYRDMKEDYIVEQLLADRVGDETREERVKRLLDDTMRMLTKREQEAVRAYVEHGTLDAAGAAMGVSGERVRQLLASARWRATGCQTEQPSFCARKKVSA